ncbi:MAG: hypothetical protein IKA07_02185 [Alistipes sp.]|nr:hypothetical protein [Alistipes sp.]
MFDFHSAKRQDERSEVKPRQQLKSNADAIQSDGVCCFVLWWQLLADETIIQNNYALKERDCIAFESAPAERRGKTSEAKSSLANNGEITTKQSGSQVSSLDYFHLIISIAFAILVDCLISIAPRGKTSEAKSSLVNHPSPSYYPPLSHYSTLKKSDRNDNFLHSFADMQ